jgi:PDZ domain-containing protein
MVMPLSFPFHVRIDSGSVGGPSAGLAFAIGIVQQLSGKDLTGPNRVAVTGTINFVPIGRRKNNSYVYEGQVGAIGGARQKALAAQAAGAKYFLVPYDNYAEALSAHAHLKVIPVGTLKQALHVLESLRKTRTAGGASTG